MSKSRVTDDPTCVVKMLDEFRSWNPSAGQTNLTDSRRPKALVPTRLMFDDSVISGENKKRKYSVSNISGIDEKPEDSTDFTLPASPWDIRRMKAELLEVKTQNINLENRLKKLYALKKESDLVFDNEKTSLLKEQERDRETIRALENRVNILKKRELETKDELSQIKQSMETRRFGLDNKVLLQQQEISRLEDQVKQVELSLHNRSMNGDRKISELEAQLKLSVEEVSGFKDYIKILEDKQVEMTNQKHQLELTEQHLAEANHRIKELELEQEKEKEIRELLEKQQQNLMRLPELDREVVTLREENRNLRDTIHNKLILEEEVMDLRKRQAGIEELEKQVSHLQATKTLQESALEQWRHLARDHCIGVPPEKAMAGPELLRMRIENLQQKELLLTADRGNLDSRLKTLQHAKATVDGELEKATKEMEKMQVKQEQQTSLIKLLQKKLLLVSRERDSYRSQLDMYEKDLTITSTSTMSNSQQQKSRIEALEKTVEGYHELVERLESELKKTGKGSDSAQINDKVQKLTEEKDALQQENEKLKKRRDELEIELEYRALKGDFNPMKSKVLHFKMNPAAQAEAEQEKEKEKLQKMCEKLQERLRLMEEGQTQDFTEAVNLRLAASSSQEVQELREQVKSYDTKIQRLKEAFKTTSQEFREVCYMLLGYKIDRIKPNLYRLSSMYAESEEDHLIFKVAGDGAELLETRYSATLEEFINLHLKHQHSIPVFLSVITIDLFNHQTLSSTDEPVALD